MARSLGFLGGQTGRPAFPFPLFPLSANWSPCGRDAIRHNDAGLKIKVVRRWDVGVYVCVCVLMRREHDGGWGAEALPFVGTYLVLVTSLLLVGYLYCSLRSPLPWPCRRWVVLFVVVVDRVRGSLFVFSASFFTFYTVFYTTAHVGAGEYLLGYLSGLGNLPRQGRF
ncbi:hypothetical protein F5X96DRAFT_422549 [Biscogniauxia mediterranea]|nr:hypothetical protein F5X96DRAFT_422549 [Biscogniauxia mediterranea]